MHDKLSIHCTFSPIRFKQDYIQWLPHLKSPWQQTTLETAADMKAVSLGKNTCLVGASRPYNQIGRCKWTFIYHHRGGALLFPHRYHIQQTNRLHWVALVLLGAVKPSTTVTMKKPFSLSCTEPMDHEKQRVCIFAHKYMHTLWSTHT